MSKMVTWSPRLVLSSLNDWKQLSPSENLKQIEKIGIKENSDVYFYIENFTWGTNKNLIVNCSELITDEPFFFSVFFDKEYKSLGGDFNFKEFKDNEFRLAKMAEPNDEIIARFKIRSSGFLVCETARLSDDDEFDKIYNKIKG